jgi:hypothetical protein
MMMMMLEDVYSTIDADNHVPNIEESWLYVMNLNNRSIGNF